MVFNIYLGLKQNFGSVYKYIFLEFSFVTLNQNGEITDSLNTHRDCYHHQLDIPIHPVSPNPSHIVYKQAFFILKAKFAPVFSNRSFSYQTD